MKLIFLFILLITPSSLSMGFKVKVEPSLKSRLLKTGSVSKAVIELPQVMDIVESSQAFLESSSANVKVDLMINMLQTLTSTSQAPFVPLLKSLDLEFTQFWASNIILVRNLREEALIKLEMLIMDVEGEVIIREEHEALLTQFQRPDGPEIIKSLQEDPQWGVTQIRAPQAWSQTQGEGVTVGVIDTGVNINHEALSGGFGGAWADPYYNTSLPTDENGHGSHVTGIIVGRRNGIGVAPRAEWIACRGLNNFGIGTESSLTFCAQFMLTSNPRPKVISNSWGGGQGNGWFNTQISGWINAGIIPVFAIGGSGPSCNTAGSPGDQPNLISVGSTIQNDTIASFSARGPSTSPSGLLKPELSAPGYLILSSWTGINDYVQLSGSSVAAPHVAGAAALILSVNPNYGFQDVLELLGNSTARPNLSGNDRECGLPIEGSDYPNNAYGYGRIDVGAALGV